MNGRLFWRTVDAAAARLERKYLKPSQSPLNKHTDNVEGNTSSDQNRGSKRWRSESDRNDGPTLVGDDRCLIRFHSPHSSDDGVMNALSRREEDTLVKATKARALKECDPLVKGT